MKISTTTSFSVSREALVLRMPLFFALLFFVLNLYGQQESQYTSFVYNDLYYNPATAGSRGMASLTGLVRQQWLGFEGAPTSQMLSFSTPIVGEKAGIGVLINHASKGIIDNVYSALSYNYKVKIDQNSSVRLGLQGSLQRWGVDFSQDNVRIQNPRDNSIDLSNTFVTWQGNVGFGALYQYSEVFSVGISAPKLYSSSISVNENLGDSGAQVSPHIYVTTTGLIELSSKLSLKPALLLKIVNDAPLGAEGNLSLIYQQQLMGGVGYRAGGDGRGESLNLLLYFQTAQNFGIGGAYDIGISELSANTGGSFEAFIRFDFGADRDDLENPRFF